MAAGMSGAPEVEALRPLDSAARNGVPAPLEAI